MLLAKKLPRFTEQIQIRTTGIQRAMIERAAAVRGETVGRFIREAALAQAVRTFKKRGVGDELRSR